MIAHPYQVHGVLRSKRQPRDGFQMPGRFPACGSAKLRKTATTQQPQCGCQQRENQKYSQDLLNHYCFRLMVSCVSVSVVVMTFALASYDR